MKPFTGTLQRVMNSHGHRYILTPEQEEWLRQYYPTTENSRLQKASGLTKWTIHRFAKKLGLTKSEKGIKAIRKRLGKRVAKINERNGCYDRKRGHAPSEATLEGNRQRWRDTREGKREHPAIAMKRDNPKKYQLWMQRKSDQRRESIRKEKMRMLYGLERKTKLKIAVLCPYKRSQIAHRFNALRRGYLLDEDCSEGQPGRYIIYYDDGTQRSAKFETNCIADGFTFKRDE